MKKLKKISKAKILNSKHFIPNKIECKSENHSWFDIETYNFGSNESIKTTSITNEFIRCKQVQIYPNKNQKKMLLNWIEIARIIYNITVLYLRKKDKIPSFYTLRKDVKLEFNDHIRSLIKQSKIPVHVIDNAIKDVKKAYNTCFALQQCGQIKRFRIRKKKIDKPKQTIVIDQQDFSKLKNGFYVGKLKELQSSKSIKFQNINHDCRLTYDINKNKFILNIPVDKKQTVTTEKYDICSIDGGLKTFLTVYNPEKECMKIMNRDNKIKLTRLVNKKIALEKLERTRNIKLAILRNNKKIANNVQELHYKSALYLCRNFNIIYLGKLSTQCIIKSKTLSTFDKHFALALSHYSFYQILKNKCNEFDKTLHYVDESYTSKTCGYCGELYDVGVSRIYNCSKCNNVYDRDMNAARNILIKNEG